jgi:hypothetical protein
MDLFPSSGKKVESHLLNWIYFLAWYEKDSPGSYLIIFAEEYKYVVNITSFFLMVSHVWENPVKFDFRFTQSMDYVELLWTQIMFVQHLSVSTSQ